MARSRTPGAAPRSPWRKRIIRGGIAGVVAIAIGVTAGPYIYIHFIKEKAPPPLSFDTIDSASSSDTTVGASDGTAASETSTVAGSVTAAAPTVADGDALSGTWTVGQPSQAGYRVKEILFGQDTEGVGRTDKVEGSVTIAGSAITAAELTVDLDSVTSDEGRRDTQFRTRLLSTDEFPVALFTLTKPIELGTPPAEGQQVTVQATGTLSLRGVEKEVTIPLTAKRDGASIAVNGSYDVVFADFGIPDPSNGAVSTQNHGLLEFLITLTKG